LHERSFIDDPTRILRAVRFEQRFGFRIERKTFLLMKEALARKALATIKPARYFSELKKILSEPEPFRYLKRLHDLGALDFVDPQLEVDFPNFRRFCRHIQQLRRRILYKNADFRLVYFVGMMAGSPKSGIGRVLSKFPWTRMERESIRQSLKREVLLKDLSAEKISASGVYRLLRPLTMETVLYLRVYARRPKVVRRIDRFLAKDKEVKLAIGGEDLKRLGMVSGEQMGKILGEVLSLKVDRCVRTKQQELRAARCLYHQVMKQRDQSRS
jgi:tRNA nucleotidyltransferase (CCA-adding enzyme)